MPTSFDRFRLLNQRPDSRIKNMSDKELHLRESEEGHPTIVFPGEEEPLTVALDGSALVDVVEMLG